MMSAWKKSFLFRMNLIDTPHSESEEATHEIKLGKVKIQ